MSALTQAEREALLRRVEYRRGSGSYPWSATVDGLIVDRLQVSERRSRLLQ